MASVNPRARPLSVVIVDADPGQRRTLAAAIEARSGGRFAATACATPAEGLAAARAHPESILVADLETVGGPEHLAQIVSRLQQPTIATSANGSLNAAIAAIRCGATDFLPKPIGVRVLMERLDAAANQAPPVIGEAAPPPSVSPVRAERAADFAGFVGSSPAMLAVYEQIRRVAPSRAPVFITGESGTGKELAAEAVHARSGVAGGRFVAINCSAIPKDLMESEIFGHVRGAFTGAGENRAGAAELAHGGTLFLDELTEMDPGLQAKLLRFVQTGSFRRVGGDDPIQVDVRIVSATNRNPATEVAEGRLRADLFYRLHVLPIHMTPLRQREEDIVPLAEAFLRRFAAEEGRAFAGFADDATALLHAHGWPGNVRELANVIRRVVVLESGPTVTAAMLSEVLSAAAASRSAEANAGARAPAIVAPYREQERAIIARALAACGGNVARAAAALEISPATIYRKRHTWAEVLSGTR